MNKSSKEITSTRHILPFKNLSSDEFERLCLWVISRSGEFCNSEHYGMTGDKGRDIIAYKVTPVGEKEQWYFNCKKYKNIYLKDFKKELDKLVKHSTQNPDFKPSVIVFITACRVSPSCQDDSKEYAKQLSLCDVYFWTDTILDEKVNATEGAVKNFFHGGIDATEIAEKTAEAIKVVFPKAYRQPEQPLDYTPDKADQINTEINEAVEFIRSKNVAEAKNRLFIILGKIQPKADLFQEELVRVYNNLGVCFNQPSSNADDLSKAKQYLEKVLDIKPGFKKAQANLAGVLINIGFPKDIEEAYEIGKKLS